METAPIYLIESGERIIEINSIKYRVKNLKKELTVREMQTLVKYLSSTLTSIASLINVEAGAIRITQTEMLAITQTVVENLIDTNILGRVLSLMVKRVDGLKIGEVDIENMDDMVFDDVVVIIEGFFAFGSGFLRGSGQITQAIQTNP